MFVAVAISSLTAIMSFPVQYHRVMMRDGVQLQTIVTVPGKDKYTAVIDRSPYGVAGSELIADAFLPLGFAAINQDFRGTHGSGGNFHLWRSSYNDTYDTVKWIVKQPWSNSDVYQVGGSADGIAALVLAGHPPIPEIKKQFIIWATAKPYQTVYPGGAYREALIHGWLTHYIKDGKEEEQETWKHESPMDPWWTIMTPNFANVITPTVFWAGWYDIFLDGNLAAFTGFQHESQAKGNAWMVVDSCGHCQSAAKQFPGMGVIAGRDAIAALLAVSLFKNELHPGSKSPEDVC